MARLVLASAGADYDWAGLAAALNRRGVDPRRFAADAGPAQIGAADFALIDGGAFYAEGDDAGDRSGAGLARRLRAPVLLALEFGAGARAAAALARGYADFDRGVEIGGLVLSRPAPEALAQAVERHAEIPVLGAGSRFDLDRIVALGGRRAAA